MASAAQSYVKGAEYEFPDGTKGVWNGKAFVSVNDYLATRGKSQSQFDDRRALMERIDRAEKKTNFFSTGTLGGWTKDIPGSPAASLAADLAPLQANEFIQGSLELRQNSPTGAGVGGQSDAEGRRFEGRTMSFDVGMPTDDMRYGLRQLRKSYARHTPGLTKDVPETLTEDNRAEIPQGAYFRAGDGRVYRNQRGAGYRPGGAPAKPTQSGRGNLPPGVTAAEWSAMTPQERALFK